MLYGRSVPPRVGITTPGTYTHSERMGTWGVGESSRSPYPLPPCSAGYAGRSREWLRPGHLRSAVGTPEEVAWLWRDLQRRMPQGAMQALVVNCTAGRLTLRALIVRPWMQSEVALTSSIPARLVIGWKARERERRGPARIAGATCWERRILNGIATCALADGFPGGRNPARTC
jgi:hypothetical protein